jgi:RNA polymerase sigma-70 factor (ECF subfamily)
MAMKKCNLHESLFLAARIEVNSRMPKSNSHEVTQLRLTWREGDKTTMDQLIPLVYGELRRLAKGHMRRERAGHTLQTTALIDEAYLRLIDASQVRLENRRHLFAAASRLMRQVLTDVARERGSYKRGGAAQQVSLDEAMVVSKQRDEELPALAEALNALAEFDVRKSQMVELRFFGGLSVEETAEVLNVSVETVHRDWRLTKSRPVSAPAPELYRPWPKLLSRRLGGGKPHET